MEAHLARAGRPLNQDVAMRGKDIVAAAMRLDVPERVPVMCQLALGHYFLNSVEDAFAIWYTSEGFARALVELARRYGFDGILVNLPGRDPALESSIERIDREAGGRRIRFRNGGEAVLPDDDNARYVPPGGRSPHPPLASIDPEKLFYIEPWDTTGVSYPYRWGFSRESAPPEDFFPPYLDRSLREALRLAGGDLSVHSEVFSPFSQFLELLTIKEGLLALADDAGKVHACLDRLTEGALCLAAGQAALGVDAILVSSAYAGAGFIGRDAYREFVLPYERRLIAGIKAVRGMPVYTHTCGAIGDRLELMVETATDGIDTLDPPPLGNVELADAKRRLAGRCFIKGNMDPVNTLLRGDREAVRADARRRLAAAAPGGGYILSSACSVPPRTPPGNVACLREAAEEWR